MTTVGSTDTSSSQLPPDYAGGDLSYYGDAAPSATGEPQQLEDNRFDALGSAGNNIQQNNANKLAFVQNDQQYALQREAIDFERDKFALGIDLNKRTVDSQATSVDAHSSILLELQKKVDQLDLSDASDLRQLSALTNSITAISQASSQTNAYTTTQTSQGHGSLQTAQSGALGTSSNTTGQQIDAGVTVAGINKDTQLGLADRKVILDTTLAGTQADVANHHADVVGAPVAQGQGNYFTGLGNNTAGFTNGANYNSNSNFDGNYNSNYGFGNVVSPFYGSFPASTGFSSPNTPYNGILSGQTVLAY